MKILIVTDTFYPHVNGSSYFSQRLSRIMKARGHDVRVLAPGLTSRNEKTDFHGVPVYGLQSYPLLSHGYRFAPPFFIRSHIRSILQDFRPDIIHCNSHFSPNTVVLPIARAMHIPVMASNHFTPENLLPYLPLPQSWTPFLRSAFWRSWTKTYRQFDTVVSPTEIAAQIVRTHTPVRKLAVISNGIDTSVFCPGEGRERFRVKLGVSPNSSVILCVGRLDREKHVDVLIRALALLDQNFSYHLLIAGKGVDQDRLKRIAETLNLKDRMTFLGFVPDAELPSLYRAVDCYAIASIAELQSISTLEAMATGLPVVAAAAMALPELVTDGENGYLFVPDNVESCADALRKTFVSPDVLRLLGARSLKRAQQHDVHRSAESFERLYQSLIKD